ncbi:MAG: TIGR01212 family radical SAM protein [Thiohalorhabdus sp.]|uniref:TIGR01212 family radical SAM protein n=1 Tax=Thiohalorhabdus sp. TaxID=3094134 RepID=UPI003980CC53
MALTDRVHTLGSHLRARHGQRVHKVAVDAGFTCPNRDGTKGRGGCTFCNNASFSPNGRRPRPVAEQVAAGTAHLGRRRGIRRFLAYFQAYTNTYADPGHLRGLYDAALAHPGVVGLAVGTRPDCAPPAVLDLLAEYRERGFEVWLELGLQSAFDATLARVNRGHGFGEYRTAVREARRRGLPVCAHLILGLPGENDHHFRTSLHHVLEEGVEGLKLHPLHVVRGTRLGHAWRRGEYRPLARAEYVSAAADLVERTPADLVFHRLTGTAPASMLLAPTWCAERWPVLNALEAELAVRGSRQGAAATVPTMETPP